MAANHNPKWTRDELVLALDLYLRRGAVSNKADQEIVELSRTLRKMPGFTDAVDQAKYRSVNSVCKKLGNFAALDPKFNGVGLRRFSHGDEAIWEELAGKPTQVSSLASEIRKSL